MNRQLRVAAIHDISCFGRCSLTVALPIISAVGVECSVIPTAVLSTHTGGFTGYTYRDLTEDIVPIVDHWKTLDLRFDAFYSGFLGSFEQIDLVADIYDDMGGDALVVVDPVMADNGKLYTVFPENFPKGMAKLCSKADVIIPNMTEAAFMLGEEYVKGPYDREYIDGLLERLSRIGAGKAILTGVYFEEGKLGAASIDFDTGETSLVMRDAVSGYYHGTGDVFGSAAVAAMVRGHCVAGATEIAVDFTVGSLKRSYAAGTDKRFGVNFEEGLGDLMDAIHV
ncbi:MAG: pyridoxamine kinase [Thermoplasmatales archaeon]|nr:pyridoxamine kinase [Thermoplasmatales archaeon]